ncbi:MAG: hypothetical protein IPI17_07530 [Nitrosomonas sp.]|jgi:hypothetical protein|nr:hypothetical protein [Nitrosomonas sp.]
MERFLTGIALIPVDTQFSGNLANPIQQPAMIEHCTIPKWLDLRMGGNVRFFQCWFDSLSTPQYTQTQ